MKLPPLPKEAFDGESETVDLKQNACQHYFKRERTPIGLGLVCTLCHVGLIDRGELKLKDGKLSV